MPSQVIKDTFYGKVYEDAYRFLENTKDSMVVKWLHQQNDKATNILHNINKRKSIIAERKKNRAKMPVGKYLKIAENNAHFYLKKNPKEKNFKLYYRLGFTGKEKLLFDPSDYKRDTKVKFIINYIQPSWNGSKIVIGFTKNDEEFSELVVLDVKTEKILSEIITNSWPAELGGVSWLNDNSGFYYLHLPVIDKSSKDYILNSASALYKLGSDPKKVNVVFSAKNNPKLNIKPADFPIIMHKPYYGNIILSRIGGVSSFQDYYYASINPKGEISEWAALFKKEDKIRNLNFNGKDFYFLSALNSPNYKLCKTSISKPDFASPDILVEEDATEIITDLAVTKDAIYFVKTKNGVDAQLYSLANGKVQIVPIPKRSGYIDVSSKSPLSNDFWIEIEGWANYLSRYSYDFTRKSFVEGDIYPFPKFPELEDVVVEELEIASHDGVKVPLSIVYQKGTQLNGNIPVIITGYGAYGYSTTPYLSPFILYWLSTTIQRNP